MKTIFVYTIVFCLVTGLLPRTLFAKSRLMTVDEEANLKNRVIRYIVWQTALAASTAQTKEDFVNILFSQLSASDKKFVLSKMNGAPAVYRVSETALGIGSIHPLILDFKDVFNNRVRVNGESWIVQGDKSIESQYPLWSRKLDYISSKKREKNALYWLKGNLFPRANAWTLEEMMAAARGLTKVEGAAAKAAQNADKLALAEKLIAHDLALHERAIRAETELEILRKSLAESQALNTSQGEKVAELNALKNAPQSSEKLKVIKTVVLGGAGITLVNTASSEVLGFLFKMLQAKGCAINSSITADCANAAMALQNAEEKLRSTPELGGSALVMEVMKASEYYAMHDTDCETRKSPDTLNMGVTIKSQPPPNLEFMGQLKYTGVGKADSGFLKDATGTTVATYKFSAGKLNEVCIPKTKKELEDERNAANLRLVTSEQRCVTEKSKGRDLDDFNNHRGITLLMDMQEIICGAVKSSTKQKFSAPPNAPEKVVVPDPVAPAVKPVTAPGVGATVQ